MVQSKRNNKILKNKKILKKYLKELTPEQQKCYKRCLQSGKKKKKSKSIKPDIKKQPAKDRNAYKQALRQLKSTDELYNKQGLNTFALEQQLAKRAAIESNINTKRILQRQYEEMRAANPNYDKSLSEIKNNHKLIQAQLNQITKMLQLAHQKDNPIEVKNTDTQKIIDSTQALLKNSQKLLRRKTLTPEAADKFNITHAKLKEDFDRAVNELKVSMRRADTERARRQQSQSESSKLLKQQERNIYGPPVAKPEPSPEELAAAAESAQAASSMSEAERAALTETEPDPESLMERYRRSAPTGSQSAEQLEDRFMSIANKMNAGKYLSLDEALFAQGYSSQMAQEMKPEEFLPYIEDEDDQKEFIRRVEEPMKLLSGESESLEGQGLKLKGSGLNSKYTNKPGEFSFTQFKKLATEPMMTKYLMNMGRKLKIDDKMNPYNVLSGSGFKVRGCSRGAGNNKLKEFIKNIKCCPMCGSSNDNLDMPEVEIEIKSGGMLRPMRGNQFVPPDEEQIALMRAEEADAERRWREHRYLRAPDRMGAPGRHDNPKIMEQRLGSPLEAPDAGPDYIPTVLEHPDIRQTPVPRAVLASPALEDLSALPVVELPEEPIAASSSDVGPPRRSDAFIRPIRRSGPEAPVYKTNKSNKGKTKSKQKESEYTTPKGKGKRPMNRRR